MPIPIDLVTTASSAAVTAVGRAVSAITEREKSLIEFSRKREIMPAIIIDNDIRHLPVIKDACHVLVSLFTAYYLQAVAGEDMLGDVTVNQRLDKFNPGRSSLPQGIVTIESRLPVYNGISCEAYNNGGQGGQKGSPRDNFKELREDGNLAVGKVYTVDLHDTKGNLRKVPITVRSVPLSMDSDAIVAAFSEGSRWNTPTERYHRMRSGDISFFGDWLLKLDRIQEHQRMLAKDTSGVYKMLSRRRSLNIINQIINGDASMATASAMMIMAAATGDELGRRLGGPLSNFAIRKQLFDVTGLMVLVTYDPKWNKFKFYYRDTVEVGDYMADEIKSASKKTDVNVAEMVNTFMSRGVPNL